MTFAKPFVSVIVPVYNGTRFLSEAVESILHQKYNLLEIIIVDDGSTDDKAKVAMSMGEGIRYIYQRNGGPASARNTGLRVARGEIIGFLDADDLWPANKLDIQLTRLIETPELDIVMDCTQYMKMPDAPDINVKFQGPEKNISQCSSGKWLIQKICV